MSKLRAVFALGIALGILAVGAASPAPTAVSAEGSHGCTNYC